jgi:tRNA G18 (ribose-2'-O)-methylase SpoU
MKTQLILETFDPRRCVYLICAEDMGYQKQLLQNVITSVKIQIEKSLNVSVAGSIVLYDQDA